MAEPSLIIYTFKELAELLVKDRGIHEGFWGIYVKFGIRAANAGETDDDIKPTALVPVMEMGLQKFEGLNNLSVNAAEVNPGRVSVRSRPGGRRATKSKRAKK